MKSVIPTLSNNPFEKDVVHEPRDHPPSVSSLNHETLNKLLSQFKTVESFGASRTRKAELILSPAPGYGKSHLVGRFFKELGNQAVRVLHPAIRDHIDLLAIHPSFDSGRIGSGGRLG
jgi:hypothetical protein